MKSKIVGISTITISCIYGLLAAIIILATILLGGNVLIAIVASIIVILLQFLIAPWLTDLSMRFFYKAKFGVEIPEYLKKFITERFETFGKIITRANYNSVLEEYKTQWDDMGQIEDDGKYGWDI